MARLENNRGHSPTLTIFVPPHCQTSNPLVHTHNMKISAFAAIITLGLISISLSGCLSEAESQEVSHSESEGESGHDHKIVVTSPVCKDVINTQPYVCQIHSCQHIEVRALQAG